MDFINHVIFLAALLFAVSILATVLSPRLGVPLLLIFMVVGMLAGEDGIGGIHFQNYALANLAATAALAVVLYDGGLNTQISTFRVALRPAGSLATLGVVITAGLTGAFAAWVLDLSLAEGMLIGAIVASTDAAAVFSLLRGQSVSLNERVSAALEIESGSNDPMAVFLTLAVISYLQAPGDFSIVDAIGLLFQQFALGAALGLAGGWLLVRALERLELADSLYPLLVLFGGLLIFGATAILGGSGFLAVYLAGLYIGNRSVRGVTNIRRFHDGIAWTSQIGMFVILGLLVSPLRLVDMIVPGLLISAALILVARPVAVFIGLAPFRFPIREQIYIAWVGLRGSVPIVLATFPWIAGLDNADFFFNLAFFIVLVSLLVQGSTITAAARLLNLQVPKTAARVQRVDIDLPGQRGYEVVSYRLQPNSRLIGISPKNLPIDDVSRIICIARRGHVLHQRDWGELRAGDYVSLLAEQSELPSLDHVFESVRSDKETAARRYFGEFSVDPDAPILALCETYGLPPPENADGISVADLLARHLPHPVVGDRLRLGNEVQLVVKRTVGDRAVEIGLRLPH